MVESFESKILHRVKVKDGGVLIEIYGGLFFIKKTAMESILKNVGMKEIEEGLTFTL